MKKKKTKMSTSIFNYKATDGTPFDFTIQNY